MSNPSIRLLVAIVSIFGLSTAVFAAEPARPILSDPALLRAAGIPILMESKTLNVGYSEVTPAMEAKLSEQAHQWNRCGGYEALPSRWKVNASSLNTGLTGMLEMERRNSQFLSRTQRVLGLRVNPTIEGALREVSEENIHNWVQWLSNYPDRYNKSANANVHVDALKQKIDVLAQSVRQTFPMLVEEIDHQSTHQKSIRVRIPGATRPNEVVVLGAHLDSINLKFPRVTRAPGADDNASGSADLLEALRIMSHNARPARTIDIFFYAGEESGLLGSAEIAAKYKQQKVNVIGALQLDMTMFPGNGELVITSMTDFTSAWLRQYMVELNQIYLNAKIVEDKCGYGCSDHASWHRQGYPALMPFEATMRTMNHNIHTERDAIDQHSSFRHAAAFCKLSLAFAMDLANSTQTQP